MPEASDDLSKPLLESKKDEVIFIPDEAGEGGPEGGDEKPFVFNSKGLSSEEATRLLEIHGLNQLPEKKVPKWKIFVNLLIAPMPLMIFFAAFIEWSIGFYETTKAADAVEALKKSLKPKATVKRDGKW